MAHRKVSRTAIFFTAAFFQGFCLTIIPAASFIFKQPGFGLLTDRQYGLCFLPMNLSAVFVTIFFKNLLGRFGRGPLLNWGVAGLGGYMAAVWAASCAHTNHELFLWLLCANLNLGIGFGLLISVSNLAMVELYPAQRDALLMGLHGFLGIGASLAPLTVEFFYRQAVWPLSHGIYLAAWALLALLLFLTRPADYCLDSAFTGACALDLHPAGRMPFFAWVFLGAIFIYGVAESITGNWATLYLTHEKGFTFQTAAHALSAFWIFLTLGRILAAFAALRMDVRILYRLSPLGIFTGLFFLLGIRQEALAVPVYAALGFSCSYFFPLSVGLSTQYHGRWKDALSSLGIAAIMAGVSFGTTLMGVLQNMQRVEISQTFMLAAACGALLIVIAWWVTRNRLPGPV